MINVEFLKRLVAHIPGGDGGWMTSYMFYMNTMSHIGLRNVPLTPSVMRSSTSEINGSFAKSVSPTETIAGSGRVLNGVEVDNVKRNRSSNADVVTTLGTSGTVSAMNYTAVLQHSYMDTTSVGADTTENGLIDATPNAPYVVAALDAAVISDLVEFEFAPILDISIKVVPEVTSDEGPLATERFSTLLESRLRDSAVDYAIGNSFGYGSGSIVGSLRGSTDNPHMFNREPNIERVGPWNLYLMSTDLEVDDYTKIARLLGTVYLPGSASVQFAYNSKLLKFLAFPAATTNPNGLCLVAFSRVGAWHSQIVGFLSNDRVKTTGVSIAIPGPVVAPSCQIFGFSGDASNKVTTSAISRAPRTIDDVLRIDKPGLAGAATYFVERYQRDLIHTALTSHLPSENPDGSKSSYFETGTFLTKAGSDIASETDAGSSQFCLQPVAFAMAQQPEDAWLYYVSMDDNFAYWLNRQELGKAHVSEALLSLSKPPLQMEVFNSSVWMLHETHIDVYNIQTGVVTVHSASVGVPQKLRAIAVDREQAKLYVGHDSGVLEFTTLNAVPITLQSTSEQNNVAPCKLVAVNNYLTWVTNAIEDRTTTLSRPPNWVVRHEVVSGRTLAWSATMLNGSGRHTDSVIASNLRSNGDMLVLHTGTFYYTPPTLTWFSISADGVVRRRNVKNYFGYWQDAYEGTGYRLNSRIFRVDDHHYSLLTIPVRLVQQPLDGTLGFFNSNLNNNIQVPWTSDFRIDDAGNRIYFYPIPKTDFLSSRRVSGTEQYRYETPYLAVPFASVYVRACDYEYAKYSSTVVILDKCYSLFVCGTQIPTSIGVELDWNGSSWVHGTAGVAKRPRLTHTTAQPINAWSNAAFVSGQFLDSYTAYKIKTFPNTSMSSNQAACYYLGDLIPSTATLLVSTTEVVVPPDLNCPSYCGIEYERTDLLSCTVDGTSLTPHTGPGGTTPDASHFFVQGNTVYLHSSHIGKTMVLNYSYVKAVSP